MIGTVNGVNFTDGVDGLVSSVTIMGCDLFLRCGNRNECGDCTDHLCSSLGAPAGFLLFNVYPASVFMGDLGSWHWAALLWQLPICSDAIIYPDRWTDLSGRSHICYGSGYLF